MRKQCLIHSRHDGSIMVIPRERDLVRFYVQLPNEDSQHGELPSQKSYIPRVASSKIWLVLVCLPSRISYFVVLGRVFTH
jgi:hypothetical protein